MVYRPEVSVVMPAYNAEKYISVAISSVIRQTFSKWELIIVDDCSMDDTWKEILRFQDERIITIQRHANSGSAYIPRMDAVLAAKGRWVVNLDADDYLGESSIEMLLEKAERQKLDICTQQMVLVGGDGREVGNRFPTDGFMYEEVFSGRAAFNLTVPRWKIGMNGALIKKEIWESALSKYARTGKRRIHDDENLSRIMMLESGRVGVSPAEYFFRINPDSVTRKFQLDIFDWRWSDKDLMRIVDEEFGVDSEEHRKCLLHDMHAYKSAMHVMFGSHGLSEPEFEAGIKLLKGWNSSIEWSQIRDGIGRAKYMVLRSFPLSLLYMMARHPHFFYLKTILKKVKSKVYSSIIGNKYYAWFIARKKREKRMRSQLENYYTSMDKKPYSNYVLCLYEGAVQGGGLADRLKGVISTYMVAKELGKEFRLCFLEPFPLLEYFSPNAYDWRILPEEICRDRFLTKIVVLDNTQDSGYQIKKQLKYLRKAIKEPERQIHVYTNASLCYEGDYGKLFEELFKPSERLQQSINKQQKLIGGAYISVSCRFLNLFGDFNETYGRGDVLSESEKQILSDRIREEIEYLYKQYPDKRILLNSDSVTFLEQYSNVDYIYTVDGNITHIDNSRGLFTYEKYEKTFLDFMMIAGAEKVFLIKSDEMYKSGFPYAASRIYNRPFEIIDLS